jgi:hypothetical protein
VRSRANALLTGVKAEGATAGIENSLHVRSGASYLLATGPALADGKSALYLLVGAAWAPMEAAAPVRAGRGPSPVLSELIAPLREAEARTATVLAERSVKWDGGERPSLAEFAAWMEKVSGARVVVDPAIDAEKVSFDIRGLGSVRAARALDAACWQVGLGWAVVHGCIWIDERGHTVRSDLRDIDLPSVEDYRDGKDREAFRALSRPVPIDLAAPKTIPDLLAAIGKATGVSWVAAKEVGEMPAIESLGFLPPGPEVIPAVLLGEVRPPLSWWIRGGVLRVRPRG